MVDSVPGTGNKRGGLSCLPQLEKGQGKGNGFGRLGDKEGILTQGQACLDGSGQGSGLPRVNVLIEDRQ